MKVSKNNKGQFLGPGSPRGPWQPQSQGSLLPGGAGNVPNAQSELSLPCQALTHHIPQKMERKKFPVPNNWILSAKRLGRRVPGFYLFSSTLKPCLFPPVWSNRGQPGPAAGSGLWCPWTTQSLAGRGHRGLRLRPGCGEPGPPPAHPVLWRHQSWGCAQSRGVSPGQPVPRGALELQGLGTEIWDGQVSQSQP